MMSLLKIFSKELEKEVELTHKFIALIPDDKFGWQPHPKSMTVKRLATHITDLPNWVTMALTTDELDFNNNNWQEPDIHNKADLKANLEKSLASALQSLQQAREETLEETWVLRQGDTIFMTDTKGGVVRMSISQIIHHRAQLGVYFRLLGIPVPGSYGPSADEQGF